MTWINRLSIGLGIVCLFLFSSGHAQETFEDAQKITRKWKYQGESYKLSFEAGDYGYCKTRYQYLPHLWEFYDRYIVADPCEDSMAWVAQELVAMSRSSWDKLSLVNFAINFVRGIPWERDSSIDGLEEVRGVKDYVRYGYEMVLDEKGDCEDHAMLFAAIMSHWCIDSILLDFPNHIAVAVNETEFSRQPSGKNYSYDGNTYYFAEPTGPLSGPFSEAYVGDISPYDKSKTPKILGQIPLICDTLINKN